VFRRGGIFAIYHFCCSVRTSSPLLSAYIRDAVHVTILYSNRFRFLCRLICDFLRVRVKTFETRNVLHYCTQALRTRFDMILHVCQGRSHAERDSRFDILSTHDGLDTGIWCIRVYIYVYIRDECARIHFAVALGTTYLIVFPGRIWRIMCARRRKDFEIYSNSKYILYVCYKRRGKTEQTCASGKESERKRK
jgi:hypothetical protein